MKRYWRNSLIIAAAGACFVFITTIPHAGADGGSHAVETGPAKFLRDHDEALKQSKKSGKPVFAFFQEVPG